MWALDRFVRKSVVRDTTSYTSRLTLYDQYGAMAYGVITQIVSEPELAQAVLIDLFASPQITSLHKTQPHTACAIVRLARMKALEAKLGESIVSAGLETQSGPDDNLPKLVFDLSFNKGFRLETIAERLEITYLDVLKAMRAYVESIRTR